MSKAKQIRAILRGQQQLFQQLHCQTTTAASTMTASSSLRILSPRPVGPLLHSDSRSIHSQPHAHFSDLQQQQQYHSKSCQRYSSRSRRRDQHCPTADRLFHTSSFNSSFASSPANATVATASSTSQSGDSTSADNNSRPESIHTRLSSSILQEKIGSEPGAGTMESVEAIAEEGEPVGKTSSSSTGRWVSELPWIDPETMESYKPGQSPKHSGSGAGNTGGNSQASSASMTSTKAMSSFFDQPFQKTRHNYVFAHGASGFAKNPGKAPVLTPEEDRAYFSVQVGEDSYFRRHDALGVADGVGGWS
ncbi:hypothetical protein BX616_007051, partial [Lobosporangium transversale]